MGNDDILKNTPPNNDNPFTGSTSQGSTRNPSNTLPSGKLPADVKKKKKMAMQKKVVKKT
jgi:hypothetical protein